MEEIARVAIELHRAKTELGFVPLDLFLSNPLLAIEYQAAITVVVEKLARLQNFALVAAEQYFTTEAALARRFEFAYVPELAAIALSLTSYLGWKLDRGVEVIKITDSKVKQPSQITAMLDRLWKLSARSAPTVGIDLFENTAGNKTAVVYIPGTQVIGFGANPLDMTSNIQAMAGANRAASEKAVLLAISQAGLSSKDEVILVGHSQGGMIAANIAASPSKFTVAGLVTFGAPIAQLTKLKLPVMAVEHVNDPVPNISGRANPMKSNWVTVQRISEKAESDAIAFSHSLKSYRNTALEIDQSKDVGVRNIRSKLLRKLEGSKPLRSLEFEISRATQ